MTPLPKTFCAFPFFQINITNDGKASLCCRTHDTIRSGNRPLSLHSETFEDIWNSAYMRTVRRAMLNGEAVAACVGCYATEADGGNSLRLIANVTARHMLDAPDDQLILAKAQEVVYRHAAIAPPPTGLHLWLGNLCNLKCRMCAPAFSSRIAADAVHSAWRGSLSRSEILLPDFRDGADYEGFGNLVMCVDGASREVLSKRATISITSQGNPIASIVVRGVKPSRLPCSLTIRLGQQVLARRLLWRQRWAVSVRPDASPHMATRTQLHLEFGRSGSGVAISTLDILSEAVPGKDPPRELLSRIPENPYWARNEKIVFDEILAHADRLLQINVSGGEPLINPALPPILERLIADGHADRIALYLTSNGTAYSRRLSGLLKQFRSVEIGFSIDGTGTLQEYIRPPSTWDRVIRNVMAFRDDQVPVSIRPTAQAYNVFGLLELVRFCEHRRIPFVLDNVLYNPPYLSLDVLPQDAIDEALEEWQSYLDNECAEDNRWHVQTVLAALRRPRPDPAEMEIRQDQFIRFTNDLDLTRSETFEASCPRLYQRLTAAGFDFRGKYRHTGRRSVLRAIMPGPLHAFLHESYKGMLTNRESQSGLQRLAFSVATRARRWLW